MAEVLRELMIGKYVREVKKQGLYNIAHSKELTKSLVEVYEKNNYKGVVIVACGSSYNGSNCGRTFAEKVLKRPVRVISPESFEFYDNLIYDDDMIVVVSFSGASTNSISALEKVKKMKRPAIGITGYAESDFKYIADLTIEFGLNGEDEPYETKGVTLQGLYFMLFALEAALKEKIITKDQYNDYKEQMKLALKAHDEVLKATSKFVKDNRKALIGAPAFTFVGTGAGYALSNEAKLKFGELIKVSTDCYELEEYIHGPATKIQPGHVVFFLDCSKKTSRRNTQIAKAATCISDSIYIITKDKSVKGNNVFYLPDIDVDDTLLHLYALVFYQQMVYELVDLRHCFAECGLYKEFTKQIPIKSTKYNKAYNDLLDNTF